MLIWDSVYYKIVFNGNMYEIINKLTGATEIFREVMCHAISEAKAYNASIVKMVEAGDISGEIYESVD